MSFTKIAAAGIGSTGTVTLENLVVTGSLSASSITGAASTANVKTDSLVVSGVTTSSGGFVGNVTGNVNSTGVSTLTTLGVSGVTTTQHLNVTGVSTFVSVGATSLNVTGVSIFSNGPVFIGSGTSTGTASQPLQVTGGAYVSGSVGIGTTNPTVKLQVLANESGSFNISAAPNASTSTVSIQNTLGDVVLFLGNDNRVSAGLGTLANNGAVITFGGKWSSTLPAANRGFGAIGAYKENNTSANQQGYLSLYTRPSSGNLVERVRIDSSGNVGIGTTNPTEKLEVAGNIKVSVGSSITVGSSFIQNNAVGLGQTTTTGRNAGVGTATGTIVFNSTTNTVEVYDGFGWFSVRDSGGNGIKATGGFISQVGGKTIHSFTGSGTFRISDPSLSSVDYLVVAGGGGGAWGGGGAGGFRTGTGHPVSSSPGLYEITVGAGGQGATSGSPNNGTSGSSSIFSSLPSTGGGGGGALRASGVPGGSGGGGGGQDVGQPVPSGGSATPGQGNAGGTGASSGAASANYHGGGGGGAGGAGISGSTTPDRGRGGPGTASAISGASVTYAGGGGGMDDRTPAATTSTIAAAAPGGGGRGGVRQSPGFNGESGTANLGGGGGSYGPGTAGSGGSGIVIIAYPS